MTKYSDIAQNPMHFPPSWHVGPPDPPEVDEMDEDRKCAVGRDDWDELVERGAIR